MSADTWKVLANRWHCKTVLRASGTWIQTWCKLLPTSWKCCCWAATKMCYLPLGSGYISRFSFFITVTFELNRCEPPSWTWTWYAPLVCEFTEMEFSQKSEPSRSNSSSQFVPWPCRYMPHHPPQPLVVDHMPNRSSATGPNISPRFCYGYPSHL